MIRATGIWGVATAISVLTHIVGGYALFAAVIPDEVPDQPLPETELQLAAYQVKRTQAAETEPQSDQAASGNTSGTALSQGSIASSRAEPRRPEGETGVPLQTDGARVTSVAPQSAPLSEVSDAADRVEALATQSPPLPAISAVSDTSNQLRVSSETVETGRVQAQALTAAEPATAPLLTAAQPAVLVSGATEILASVSPAIAMKATSAPEAVASVVPVVQQAVAPESAATLDPPAERSKAAFAFQGESGSAVDPVSLSAFQSFMEPGDLSGAAADVRDGISGVLSAIPCSRLQVEFDPENNALLVSGHVPEPSLRGAVLSSMQVKMGRDIPVRDNLLILPRPQCGALAGIASVGLPQSTDQITNPLLLGEDTHAREFHYTEGQPLVMRLQGADYDAFVYVDYFDANGNVLHLLPNEFTPMERTTAKSALQIGSDTILEPGQPGLYIEIGPPFGQEIAVAFAASEPLYEGVRPLVEPAEPYLDWLREQVAAARFANADFKGEWVYFFVSTSGN